MLGLLKVLPENNKVVFNLHVFEAYNHKEIAEFLGITENHSYWLLHQARKKSQGAMRPPDQKTKRVYEYE